MYTVFSVFNLLIIYFVPFQVMYCELAFIRFMVTDTVTGHIVSQRVIPLKCVRPGMLLPQGKHDLAKPSIGVILTSRVV